MDVIIPISPILKLAWWLFRAFLYLITCKRINLFKKKGKGNEVDIERGQVKKIELNHNHTHKMTHDHNHNHKFSESFKIRYLNEAPTNTVLKVENIKQQQPNVSESITNALKQFLNSCQENNVEKAFHYFGLVMDVNAVSPSRSTTTVKAQWSGC